MSFRDLFSRDAASYATFRPRYPAVLFQWLAGLVTRRVQAWDCATGNGQAAVALAAHFDRVHATDASAQQIANAQSHARVTYRVALAEHSGLDSDSTNLVTVAQALHWLDRDAFFTEAGRVLGSGGVVAAWCYALARIEPRIDAHVDRMYHETLRHDWTPERRLVDEGYSSVAMPFARIETPAFVMQHSWTLAELLGYLGTWSAVVRHRERTNNDPLAALANLITPLWGPPDTRRMVTWPVSVIAGRKETSIDH